MMSEEPMNEEVVIEENASREEATTGAESDTSHRNGDGNGEAVGEIVDGEVETETQIETPAETIARLESELAAAQAQAAEAVDRMQRTAAEFQNTRKRQERMLQESLGRATERLLVALLPVLDDFDLAFRNLPDTLTQEEQAWVDGFQRIQGKLFSILSEDGLKAIELEGPFDPNLHEAVTNEPSEDVESGHIIDTLRTGYILKEKVLRPGLVRVAE
ncbi:MAG: nucleotide exchange factor GrpE [Caldilineaceae bacterium]